MPDVTPRMSAADFRQLLAQSAGRADAPRRNKFGNRKSQGADGRVYDSGLEHAHAQRLDLARSAADPAQRVTAVECQRRFLLIDKQPGERSASYVADFVVTYADGHVEVHDTKSAATRRLPAYVLKRKLMLSVHGIRILEF